MRDFIYNEQIEVKYFSQPEHPYWNSIARITTDKIIIDIELGTRGTMAGPTSRAILDEIGKAIMGSEAAERAIQTVEQPETTTCGGRRLGYLPYKLAERTGSVDNGERHMARRTGDATVAVDPQPRFGNGSASDRKEPEELVCYFFGCVGRMFTAGETITCPKCRKEMGVGAVERDEFSEGIRNVSSDIKALTVRLKYQEERTDGFEVLLEKLKGAHKRELAARLRRSKSIERWQAAHEGAFKRLDAIDRALQSCEEGMFRIEGLGDPRIAIAQYGNRLDDLENGSIEFPELSCIDDNRIWHVGTSLRVHNDKISELDRLGENIVSRLDKLEGAEPDTDFTPTPVDEIMKLIGGMSKPKVVAWAQADGPNGGGRRMEYIAKGNKYRRGHEKRRLGDEGRWQPDIGTRPNSASAEWISETVAEHPGSLIAVGTIEKRICKECGVPFKSHPTGANHCGHVYGRLIDGEVRTVEEINREANET